MIATPLNEMAVETQHPTILTDDRVRIPLAGLRRLAIG
jgi:hypothetical protein